MSSGSIPGGPPTRGARRYLRTFWPEAHGYMTPGYSLVSPQVRLELVAVLPLLASMRTVGQAMHALNEKLLGELTKREFVAMALALAGVPPAVKRRVFPPERTASANASGGDQNRARALPGVESAIRIPQSSLACRATITRGRRPALYSWPQSGRRRTPRNVAPLPFLQR